MEQKTLKQEKSTGFLGGLKVLVMDDESMIRYGAQQMLKALGHNVELAKHGVEAVEKYSLASKSKGFDVVILDMNIPGGMGGIETLKKLQEINPFVAAVISSGCVSRLIKGFRGVLPKPYTLEELKNVVAEVGAK